MQLKPFLLDIWLDAHEHQTEFNLASSTGPAWTVNQILDLDGADARERLLQHTLVYGRPAGADNLRAAIARFHRVEPEAVQVVTGASEALLVLMWLAAAPGANVLLPRPGFATFSALPESLGLETRFYGLRRENHFRIDLDEIERLADRNTKLILVNSPHNPTGAVVGDREWDRLDAFAAARGIQLVSDEVYHPVFHGEAAGSASRLEHATVIHDFSKAFPLSGVRTGWMIERDPERRQRYWTARSYFSITNNSSGEFLAELAMRHHATVLGRTQQVASRNLQLLESFFAAHSDILGWVRPQGGTTAFPWLRSGENARAFCQAASERGLLLAPGDCFDTPEHFRLGFGAESDKFPAALERFAGFLKHWAAGRLATV